MARPLLSVNVNPNFRGQQNNVNWQTNSNSWQQKNNNNLLWQQQKTNNTATVALFPVPPVMTAAGILGATPRFQNNTARPLLQQQPASILGQKPSQSPNSILQNKLAPWQHQQISKQNNPPSLLDMPSGAAKFTSSPTNRNHNSSYNRMQQDKQNLNKPPFQSPTQSTQHNKKENLEKLAMEKEITEEFYDEIKHKGYLGQAMKFAGQYARSELHKSKGMSAPSEKPIGSGNHTCLTCLVNFDSRPTLNQHYKSDLHRELEELINVRREQAKLIHDGKLKRPQTKSTLESLRKAETEMNLKPTEMELDPYILGIYESIMKPYWPVPKSLQYCRICNYMEFSNKRELDRHNASRDHARNEENYNEAFCLFCQVHNIRKDLMIKHEKTEKHKETKELMEKTKDCAIRRWHELNKLELPDNMKIKKDSEQANPGEKRTAPHNAANASPTKKMNTNSTKDGVIDLVNAAQNSTKEGYSVNTALNDKTRMWFVPMTGFMCVACHTFIANEKMQEEHLREGLHVANVARFKKML